MTDLILKKTVDCNQGAVRAIRYNGKRYNGHKLIERIENIFLL